MEFLERGHGPLRQERRLLLLGQADEPAGQERQRPARMREDPADVGEFCGGAAEDDMGDRARRIGRVLDRPRRDARHQSAAAVRCGRVNVDHCLAPVELFVDRRKRRIAEILVLIAGEQPDAVGLERVERVFDLLEASLHIRRRDAGEQPEAAGMIFHHGCAVFVKPSGEAACLLHIVAIPDAGLDDGQDRGCDPALVHVLERGRRRPFRWRGAGAAARRHHRIHVERRDEVMMHVDARGGRCARRRRDLAERRGGAEPERSGAAGEKISPRRAWRGRQCGRELRLAAPAGAKKRVSLGAHPNPRKILL